MGESSFRMCEDGALVGEGSGGVIATIHQRSTQSDPSDLADCPAMSFVFVCSQIKIRNTNQLSWAITLLTETTKSRFFGDSTLMANSKHDDFEWSSLQDVECNVQIWIN